MKQNQDTPVDEYGNYQGNPDDLLQKKLGQPAVPGDPLGQGPQAIAPVDNNAPPNWMPFNPDTPGRGPDGPNIVDNPYQGTPLAGTNPHFQFPGNIQPSAPSPNPPGIGPGQPLGRTGPIPSYVNPGDPASQAVWNAFQQKGLTPRDQQDFEYWVNKINQTGGWGNPGNQAYWLNRMAQAQGGVGDYQERPEVSAPGFQTGPTIPSFPGSAPRTGTLGPNGLLSGSVDNGEFLNTFRNSLLDALKQFSQPTTPESPTIAPQISAARVSSQRGLDQSRNALAEQAYAGGRLDTAGYDQAQQQAIERAGQNESQLEAGLVNQGEQQRLDALMRVLGMGSTQGLQQQISGDQLGYQYAALQQAMNRDAMLAALGYYGG